MRCLTMNAGVAKTIAGKYSATHELIPIQIAEDIYILPADVLDEPNYEAAFEALRQCEVVEVTDETN